MSSFVGLGVWQLLVLSVLGGLSVVGLAVTIGARARMPERPMWRGEYVVASMSAALWVAVMLTFFSISPWWGRLVLGVVLAVWASLTSRAQLAGLFSAAYARRKPAEADSTGQEAQP